jgi:hypothetical protein
MAQRIAKFLLFILFILQICLIHPYPVIANSEKPLLTAALLQEKISHPVSSKSNPTFDFSSLTIDLTDNNAEFRSLFYQELKNKLNRSSQPINLDFSHSLLKGSLEIEQIGLVTFLILDKKGI